VIHKWRRATHWPCLPLINDIVVTDVEKFNAEAEKMHKEAQEIGFTGIIKIVERAAAFRRIRRALDASDALASSANRKATGRPPSVASASTCFPDADPTMTPRDRPLHPQVRVDAPNKKPRMSAMPPDKRFAYWDCALKCTRRSNPRLLLWVPQVVCERATGSSRNCDELLLLGVRQGPSCARIHQLTKVLQPVHTHEQACDSSRTKCKAIVILNAGCTSSERWRALTGSSRFSCNNIR